jgi:hypothetical protein
MSQDSGDIGIEYHTLELREPQGALVHVAGVPTPMPTALCPEPVTPIHAVTPALAYPPPQPEFVSPPPNTEEYLNADTSDVQPQYHTVTNILGAGS